MTWLSRARFATSAHTLDQLPDASRAEVAFAGRSNAGKSTALNAITAHRRLAFASKTPGRTQLINFFDLGEARYLVDLPGYGFANVPERQRRHWGTLISRYLGERPSLAGLIVIMDVRHPLTPLDRQLLDWFLPTGKPVHILLTKADKLSRQQAAQQLAIVRRALAEMGAAATVQLFSAVSGLGIDTVRQVLVDWLGIESKEKPPAKGE